jgi:3-oxoacyl-[acyl-carrier protein] reductase
VTNTILIWGAAGGIGSAILSKFARQGWHTVGISRRSSADIQADLTLEADVSDPFSVQQVIYRLSSEIDSIDVWVYCVGDILAKKIAETSAAEWKRILDANLNGVFITLQNSLPLLAANAHVVVLGAVSERMRLPGLGPYAAAKAGLEAFMESVAKEERHRKFLLVRPAAVDTRFWEKVPFRKPANAISVDQLAQDIFDAIQQGKTGRLDL